MNYCIHEILIFPAKSGLQVSACLSFSLSVTFSCLPNTKFSRTTHCFTSNNKLNDEWCICFSDQQALHSVSVTSPLILNCRQFICSYEQAYQTEYLVFNASCWSFYVSLQIMLSVIQPIPIRYDLCFTGKRYLHHQSYQLISLLLIRSCGAEADPCRELLFEIIASKEAKNQLS